MVIETEVGRLVKMEILHLLKFSDNFIGVEVHVLVNGKYVKLNYANDVFVQILRKLQQKEVSEVYINEDDCKRIVEEIKQSLSEQSLNDSKLDQAKRVEIVSAALDTVKGVINQLGVEPETVKLLKTINTRAMALLQDSPSLLAFIREFKKNCSEEFLLSILTNYIMSLMIDKFPWRSAQVKEKGALASLMCDMTLKPEDFAELRAWKTSGGKLSSRLKMHPADIANKLKKDKLLIPIETITIIEQHHEFPDGSGFPYGINANRFNQLSAIFIVAQQFAERLHEARYDYDKRSAIIKDIRERYSSKVFDKAVDALTIVVG